MRTRFGTAGVGDSFMLKGYKDTLQVPEYLSEFSLDAYEYQFGRGVRISQERATLFGEQARAKDITLSAHAPYYISLTSIEEEKRLNSINYILQTAIAAKAMGAKRVILHSGSCSKISREQALELAKDTLRLTVSSLKENQLEDIVLCPETMGKINQLGNIDEVLELCSIEESSIPCIDFGHLNARTNGGLKDKKEIDKIFKKMENKLGYDRMRVFHSHFSKIEYTEKGGELRHLTFEDDIYGPDYEYILEIIAKKSLTPTIICESAGSQAEDAKILKEYYDSL